MNQEESKERDSREERYRDSQDDISVIRRELNKLTSAVGELVTSLRGNDLGTEGIIAEVRKVAADQLTLEKKFADLERMAKTNQKYLLAFIGAIGVALGTLGKSIIDHVFKK